MDIEELRKVPHLSASAVNDYLACGLLYKLKRIDKLEVPFTSDALELGSVVHETLAAYYEAKQTGRKMSLEELLTIFTANWEEAAGDADDIEYGEGKDFGVLLEEGKALLAAYHEGLADDRFKVLGIEEGFQFHVEGLPILGIIDLIEEDEAGTIIITDFKTASRAYSSDEIDKNIQLTIYHMAAKANGYANREILLRFHCLIKTKKPRFEEYFTVRSGSDVNRTRKKILAVWDGIQKCVFVPNDTGWRCGYCDVWEHCARYLEAEEVEP